MLKRLALVASAVAWWATNLHAQSAPTITNQPVSQTNLAGANVTFSVAVDGTGPFNYQWQLNGTNLPENIITTVAGNGTASFSGDGGAATNASLTEATGVALDAAGNLYIADTLNERVRKVDTNGIITTVAGDGSASYAGDGHAATNASLHYPWDLAFDSVGNLYIADTYNSRIRKVDTNGIITTVAGNGIATFAGDDGAATNASLNYPYGVALDAAGNLYISDGNNNRIREVGPNGIITTVAGGGDGRDGGAATSASLDNPSQIAFDTVGNLYIADSSDNRIRKMDTNGIITTVAGNGIIGFSGDGGAATNARLSYPTGVALDADGNLYIVDFGNNRIREANTNGMITTVAGGGAAYPGNGGAATNATLGGPQRVALDASGNLYCGDTQGSRIREVHFGGYPTFTLTDVSTNNSGNYMVIITSPYGSVTSAVATLTVTIPSTPPLIITNDASFGFLTNQFGFNVSGAFGQTIVVDGSTDLVEWTPLFTNIVGGSPFYFFDPAWTNFPWRFYRARLP
jgi:sugar lactone lactonase YvrE